MRNQFLSVVATSFTSMCVQQGHQSESYDPVHLGCVSVCVWPSIVVVVTNLTNLVFKLRNVTNVYFTLVVTSTPMVTPTLDQMVPTTTAMSTPMVTPTLDQMTSTTTVTSTPTVMPTLDQTMPKTTVMPKQVVRKMLAVKTPKGVYASVCVFVCVCRYRCLHLLENFK